MVVLAGFGGGSERKEVLGLEEGSEGWTFEVEELRIWRKMLLRGRDGLWVKIRRSCGLRIVTVGGKDGRVVITFVEWLVPFFVLRLYNYALAIANYRASL